MSLKNLLVGPVSSQGWQLDLGLLILRVMAGLAMAFGHGIGKIPPSEKFIEGVAQLGFPLPTLFAWCAGFSEFFGGICLAIGLFVRPASALILFTMGTAFFLAHAADPFKVKELAFLFLGIATLFFFVGSGRFSVDAILRRK